MYKVPVIVFTLFSLLPFFCKAQLKDQPLIDSLLRELSKSKKDTNKVNILADLSFGYNSLNTSEGIRFGNLALALARDLKFGKGIFNAYNSLGVNYEMKQDYPRATDYYNHALTTAGELGNKKYVAREIANLGDVYSEQKNYIAGTLNYLKAYNAFEEIKDKDDMARMLSSVGINYSRKGVNDSASQFDSSALKLYLEAGNIHEAARMYGNLGVDYQNQGNLQKAMDDDDKSLKLYEKFSDKEGIARILGNVGNIYQMKANFPLALVYDVKSLKLYEELEKKDDILRIVNNMAAVYNSQANYPNALEYYFKALKIYEELNSKDGIASATLNIGWVYFFQNNFAEALEYDFKALKIYEETDDKNGLANTFSGIGSAYAGQGKFTESIDYLNRSEKIYESINSKSGILTANINLGDIYFKDKNYPFAISVDFKALAMARALNDSGSVSIVVGNIGECYLGLARDTLKRVQSDSLISKSRAVNLQRAIEYLTKGVVACKESGNVNAVMEDNQYLSEAYALIGNFKEAYKCHLQFTDLKDSIFSTANNIKTTSVEIGRDLDLKNKDLEIKNKQFQIDQLEVLKKRNERVVFISGVILLLVIIGIMFRNHWKQMKTNQLLALEKDKSERLLDDIRVKNKAITDNIDYARRIQSAILPDVKLIYKALERSFILYKPKDIVSGDFYAFAEKNRHVLIIAGDCTGHGVSGAFMSMIGSSLLTQIINEKGIKSPEVILNHLNSSVIDTFRQSKNDASDGMDIAICSLDSDRQELHFAGANRPLWLIRNQEIIVIKPDKFPIGGMQVARDRVFTNHIIKLQQGDTFYIFTDGYADQFGGDKGKKLMTAKFKELLLSIQHLSMPEQETYLKNYLENWEGFFEQVDDVLVIGVRI